MGETHSHTARAVILTALPVEYRAVRQYLQDLQEEVHPQGTVYERGRFISPQQSWEIGLVETRMGIARAAFEAERAIEYFQPRLILFVGIAGGLKTVKLGDVVAATKAYGYESGKAGGSPSFRVMGHPLRVPACRETTWARGHPQGMPLPITIVSPERMETQAGDTFQAYLTRVYCWKMRQKFQIGTTLN